MDSLAENINMPSTLPWGRIASVDVDKGGEVPGSNPGHHHTGEIFHYYHTYFVVLSDVIVSMAVGSSLISLSMA